jgi:hypothetical protein
MILDEQSIFSDKQAITSSTASTNIIKAVGEIAYGTEIPIFFQVEEDFAGATSVAFSIQTAEDENFTTTVTLATTGAIPIAQLKKGYFATLNYMPKGNLGYIRSYYTVVGTATAGKITSGITTGTSQGHHNK